jgi:hypothetical protein
LCELGDVLGGRDQASLEKLLEAGIEVNSEMYLEAVIQWVWCGFWRPRSSNSDMHMEAEIWLDSEMQLEAMIERTCGCPRRPRS